ncbi:FAD/NAD(P)-binding protein [Roseomonas sp. 18066]|uniref:FAD/NAD(P)-binding protein n=1 Tax=Roseomonas sp. 18066 TaxID=2681412 RepID=UPI00135AE5AD|nr:FAD/NAD(P)-binding protein [Roseomonas sp. 18066]
MTRNLPVVAIIGGGFAGTALALQLAGKAGVTLFEPAPVGPGLAYGTAEPAHLLNVPAAGMSPFPDKPAHFTDWLAAQPDAPPLPAAGPRFAPRYLYGRYLQELWAAAAPAIRHVPRGVASVERAGAGFRVTDTSGEAFAVDRVVLAVGGFAATPGAPPHLAGDPWDPAALEGLAPEAPLLLVGLGLTMVDVLLALRERGHVGPVTAISRHGWLPLSHLMGVFPPPWPMALAEGEAPGVLAAFRWLRVEVARAAAAGQPWQAVIDGVRPLVQRIWRGWDSVQRRRFLRHARSAWNLHRHRLAPEAAGRIGAELATGGLRPVAARLADWRVGAQGVEAVLDRRGGGQEVLSVARIILCTGPEGGAAWREAAPVAGMLAAGLLAPDALGLGLSVSPEGVALDAAGQQVAGIDVLGPLTRGALWEITAVPDIRLQVAGLADRIDRGKYEIPACGVGLAPI